jgi:hypothetical protein
VSIIRIFIRIVLTEYWNNSQFSSSSSSSFGGQIHVVDPVGLSAEAVGRRAVGSRASIEIHTFKKQFFTAKC